MLSFSSSLSSTRLFLFDALLSLSLAFHFHRAPCFLNLKLLEACMSKRQHLLSWARRVSDKLSSGWAGLSPLCQQFLRILILLSQRVHLGSLAFVCRILSFPTGRRFCVFPLFLPFADVFIKDFNLLFLTLKKKQQVLLFHCMFFVCSGGRVWYQKGPMWFRGENYASVSWPEITFALFSSGEACLIRLLLWMPRVTLWAALPLLWPRNFFQDRKLSSLVART